MASESAVSERGLPKVNEPLEEKEQVTVSRKRLQKRRARPGAEAETASLQVPASDRGKTGRPKSSKGSF